MKGYNKWSYAPYRPFLYNVGDIYIIGNNATGDWLNNDNNIAIYDNGWRFLSEVDTDEYLQDASNMVVCDWGTLFEIEPAISLIYDMPVGTDLTLVYENGRKYFVYTETGERCVF